MEELQKFDCWNKQKKEINAIGEIPFFFKEREIWWVTLGLNIGFEQDGKGEFFKRPILIIKKFNKHVVLAVPLTTKHKEGKYYVECVSNEDQLFRMAIISQIRLIDSKRLIDKIGMVNEQSFREIRHAIRALL